MVGRVGVGDLHGSKGLMSPRDHFWKKCPKPPKSQQVYQGRTKSGLQNFATSTFGAGNIMLEGLHRTGFDGFSEIEVRKPHLRGGGEVWWVGLVLVTCMGPRGS